MTIDSTPPLPAVLTQPKTTDAGVPVNARNWGIYARNEGQAHSAIHFHDCDEWYFILEGEGEIKVGDETVNARPMDLIHVPAGVVHGTERSKGEFRLLYVEGPLRGRGRSGHLKPGVDAPFEKSL